MDFNDFDDFTDQIESNNQFKTSSKTNKSFDFITLLVSLIGGIAGYFISGYVYQVINDSWWSPLAIGIRLLIFFLVVFGFVLGYSLIKGNLQQSRNSIGKNITFLIITAVLVFILAAFFEFIYEMDFFKKPIVTSDASAYIFVIDNSSSMDNNDPDNLRYAAINDIMADKSADFLCAVYSFNEQVICQRDFAPKSLSSGNLEPLNSGQTYIKKALQEILNEYQNNRFSAAKPGLKVLFLSDGNGSDISGIDDISSILDEYLNNNIAISTVGLGNDDETLMQEIAYRTGGIYVSIDDASQLSTAMTSAIEQSSNPYARTLFTYRNVPSLDILYALMRIIFTVALGLLISVSMIFATGKDNDYSLLIIGSIITSVIAGILLELGINLFKLDPSLMTLIYMLLVASIFVYMISINISTGHHNLYTSNHKYHSSINNNISNKRNVNNGDNNLRF
ncbi:vWA domain-containing protein [uncultured Thomasclavelia sp.]|uniref:VWA domain-containing protein n=1 Tax=uncultured Thomasclavelia sp. TaxID=3025759 RepID=UPI0025F375F0|nr:vWA domain-containing protein [uncultured Thomasclavelia sp.]